MSKKVLVLLLSFFHGVLRPRLWIGSFKAISGKTFISRTYLFNWRRFKILWKVFRKRFSRYLKRTNFLWPVIWKPFIIRAYLCTIAVHWTFLCTIVHNFALFFCKIGQSFFCIKLPCSSCQRVLTAANQCVPTKSWRKNICQKQHLQCWDLAASCFKTLIYPFMFWWLPLLPKFEILMYENYLSKSGFAKLHAFGDFGCPQLLGDGEGCHKLDPPSAFHLPAVMIMVVMTVMTKHQNVERCV